MAPFREIGIARGHQLMEVMELKRRLEDRRRDRKIDDINLSKLSREESGQVMKGQVALRYRLPLKDMESKIL